MIERPERSVSVELSEGNPMLHGYWIAITFLTAALVAVGATLLARAGGSNLPKATLVGGGAFAGTVSLFLAVLIFAASPSGLS